MNAARLLALYERIAEAPDAVARLRRFVLDLAVRGKLVPQDAGDEPASELLKRIARERAWLVKAGEIRKPKENVAEPTELAFTLPSGWTSAPLDQLSPRSLVDGDWIETKDQSEIGNVRLIQLADVGVGEFLDKSARFITEATEVRLNCTRLAPGDVLIARLPNPIGRACLFPDIGQPAITAVDVAILRPDRNVDPGFLIHALNAPPTRSQIEAYGKGSTRFRVSTGHLKTVVVPLPPLAEQHRIVAKVDELMALCDQLEAARTARETTRDRLAAASLARLNTPDPETFPADARFALDALPALTTRPDQIKHLRQTILNLAVRGKLVPQDAGDEPASELLKQISKEKARLVREGKAKRQDALPEIDLDQAPFELPNGWSWGRFPEIGTFGRGKSKHRPRNDPALFDGGHHLMIQTGDVARSQGVIETYTSKYNDFGLSQSFKWPKGTLCITIAANIADSGILSFDACFPDSVVGFIPASMFENARYFEYFVRTAKANLLEFAPATAQKNINLEILTQVLIPLPPLAEQRRIVAKVNELMSLCDALEASLTAATTGRTRLLEATLAEALAHATAQELEAAE